MVMGCRVGLVRRGGAEMTRVRVLIVEEHDKVRREMTARLGSEPDLELVGAATPGEEAVALVQRVRPDVILLGLGMQGGKGLETCRKVATLVPEARILVLTSYEDEAEKREAYRAGACRYLLKDLHSRELIEAIEGPRITHSQKGGRKD
jgi:NarL family two-component system response regulator LiaR